ncbi:hypothetical protein CR513_11734, partial [Mucuna pruriens]
MTGKESRFQDLPPKKGGKDDKHPFMSIECVLYVKRLKHNLLSISQLCESGYDVSFNKGECIVKDYKGSIIFSAKRQNNLYKIDLANLTNKNATCLVSISDDQWTWHKKLGHPSLRLISKLKKHNLVRGLSILVFKVDLLCDACQKRKQIRGSFESKHIVSTSRY